MVKVSVPATTANIGSGFDCVGAALTLYNEVFLDFTDGPDDVASLDGTQVPDGERNLVCIAARELMRELAVPERGLFVRQRNNIPMARGLGSSSACIAAGLLGANELLGSKADRACILRLAARLEGHPDNVVPAVTGGAAVCCIHSEQVLYGKTELDGQLCFAAFVPDYPLETARARKALPPQVPMQDAVYNISRCGLLIYALSNRRYELLREATKDRLHQPYRLKLMPGAQKIIDYCLSNGAYACYVSGAGPTIMALADSQNNGFFEGAQRFLCSDALAEHFSLLKLRGDNTGAVTETVGEVK